MAELSSSNLSKGESGFSLQDAARYDIFSGYKLLRRHQKTLIEEKVKYGGFVKIKTALESLNDLYLFVDEVELKNRVHYHRKELKDFKKFTFWYFEPQLKILMEAKKKGQDKIVVGQNGFSIFHYRRWKLLCRLLLEVSGITKFERPRELTPEMAFAASV